MKSHPPLTELLRAQGWHPCGTPRWVLARTSEREESPTGDSQIWFWTLDKNSLLYNGGDVLTYNFHLKDEWEIEIVTHDDVIRFQDPDPDVVALRYTTWLLTGDKSEAL